MDDALTKILKPLQINYKYFGLNSVVLYKRNVEEPKVISSKNFEESQTPIVSNLRLLSDRRPIYPHNALINSMEGQVIVKVLVNKRGGVDKVLVEKSSGHKLLDNHTVNFVKNLKYSPFAINGVSKASWTYITYSYLIQESRN